MVHREMSDARRETAGLVFGALAVLIWSTAASLITLGVARMPLWPFVSLTTLLAGLSQLAFRWAQTRNVRPCFLLPWRIWIGAVLPFVVYGLAFPLAIAISASPSERLAVNLINYLWPVLTVVFSVLWVPGIVMTRRLLVAIVLTVAGLLLANVPSLRIVFSGGKLSVRPYVFGGIAAVTWGIYSSLLARWRSWACAYQTVPVGFLLVGCLAGIIALSLGQWRRPIGVEWINIAANGLLPCGLGYMLWEYALHRARASILGVFGATIPVTSTLLLCLAQRHWPHGTILPAAIVIAAAVLLTIKRRDGAPLAVSERID